MSSHQHKTQPLLETTSPKHPQPWDPDWDVYYTEQLGILTSDRFLGSLIVLGVIVGILGNGSAVFYFWPRRHKTIHDFLYLAITTVDFMTVSSIFPLVVSLFSDRRLILFTSTFFCSAWTSVIIFTARMSMFLAMLICITRTLAIKFPQRPIKKKLVKGVIVGYGLYTIVIDAIFLPQGWYQDKYFAELSSCARYFYSKYDLPKVALYFGVFQTVELMLPSLITFVCFVIVTRYLMKRQQILGNEEDRKMHRASVTITIFTAIFLVFNIPCFLYLAWQILWVEGFLPGPSDLYPEDQKFKFYIQLLLQGFPVFLNASINPVLYSLRMRGYRHWLHHVLKKTWECVG